MSYVNTCLTEPRMPNQRGSTCGLYALAGVIRTLLPNTNVVATGDHRGEGPVLSTSSKPRVVLRKIAKGLHISQVGEIFRASDMKRLVDEVRQKHKIGISAKVVVKPKSWSEVIVRAIKNKCYLLAPFGVENSGANKGMPQTRGTGAHWCVVWGYARCKNRVVLSTKLPTGKSWNVVKSFRLPPAMYARVRHWGKNYWFQVDELRESSKRLKTWDQQKWYKIRHGSEWKKLIVQHYGPWWKSLKPDQQSDFLKWAEAAYKGIKYVPHSKIQEQPYLKALVKKEAQWKEIKLPETLADHLVILGTGVL